MKFFRNQKIRFVLSADSKNLLFSISFCIFFAFSYSFAYGATFITSWGSSGSGDGQFSTAYGITRDSSSNIYVSEVGNNRIQKFDSSGGFLSKWGSSGSGDGQFSIPTGIATDSSGNIYVTELVNSRVQKFNSSGVFVTKWGSAGSSDGQFNFPYAVDTDSSENVYVVDSNNHRIQKFTPLGVFMTKWGTFGTGDGQFNVPRGIAIDSSNNVYVMDTDNRRVQKFDSSGTFITKWGSAGSANGQFSSTAYSVSTDSSGNVYVVDTGNSRIQRFDSSGTYMTKWGSAGSSDGQFNSPQDSTIDSSGNIYVSDTNNSRIQKFEIPELVLPTFSYFNPADNATGVSTTTNFEIAFSEAVSTSTGNIVLYKTSDNSVVETIPITGGLVTASSTNAFIINPSTTLDYETEYYFTLATTSVIDLAGNRFAGITASTTWSFTTTEITAPTITSVSSDKADGTYGVGSIIDIDVTFSEAVTSTGSVTVTLETGDTDRSCEFTVTSATTGTCNYTVVKGDSTSDLNVLSISGTILDVNGNPMVDFIPATNLSSNRNIVIDTRSSSSGSTSATRRIQNLIEMGNFLLAEELISKYPNAIPNAVIPVSKDETKKVEPKQKCISNEAFSKNLKFGDMHEDVRRLQKTLNCLGFSVSDIGVGSYGNETNIFGVKTRDAVRRFQLAKNIAPPVGFFGPITRGVINGLKFE